MSSSLLTALIALALHALLPTLLTAQVQEWLLVDRGLQTRATAALKRYYTVVVPDSTRVRYIQKNAAIMPYRLRGVRTDNDTLGWLLSISLGQLTLPTVTSIRIALGDDLYNSVLLSRNDPLAERRDVPPGDPFGYNDWNEDQTLMLALDRAVYRMRPEMAAFAAIGAPESNQFWWSDGTMRVGTTTPGWEFAVVLPFGSGATPVGPLRARLLAPGIGAAGMVRLGDIIGRARFTTLTGDAFRAPQSGPSLFVHTLSWQALYARSIETTFGPLYLAVGGGYEEFTKVEADSTGDPVSLGRVRRVSPIADLIWTHPARNIDVGIGMADLSLRGSFTARLTERLSIELRWVSNEIFRKPHSFEHPFLLFITPQIRF